LDDLDSCRGDIFFPAPDRDGKRRAGKARLRPGLDGILGTNHDRYLAVPDFYLTNRQAHMRPTNNRVLVRVNLEQKSVMKIGETTFSMALKYETNYREKSPVIAQIVQPNDLLSEGDLLLCHHNHFYLPSPYHLQDDLFSIPANHTILAVLRPSGELTAVYGNVLAAKVEIPSLLPLPPEKREHFKDRGLVVHGGGTEFQPGDLVFTRPSAIYEIVYIFGEVEHRVCKINSEMICAVVPAEEKN
jgi:hypothetical protein